MGTAGRLKQRAYDELKEFLVIALYLWVVLGLFLVYKSVILNEEHFSYLFQGVALINALVLGKFVLIARAFHLGDRANDAPLIYPTVLKSALFSVVLACCKILEDVAVGFYHGKSFSESIADLAGGTWKGILTCIRRVAKSSWPGQIDAAFFPPARGVEIHDGSWEDTAAIP
jgi:hypothetical protein